ncbi:MAG: hypothetical protein ACQEUT_01655 [Bacillota bacterium]
MFIDKKGGKIVLFLFSLTSLVEMGVKDGGFPRVIDYGYNPPYVKGKKEFKSNNLLEGCFRIDSGG